MLYITQDNTLVSVDILPPLICGSIVVILNGVNRCVYLSKSDFRNCDIFKSFSECLSKRTTNLDRDYVCPLYYIIDYTAIEFVSNYITDIKLALHTNFIYIDCVYRE
jgi:hypothetical protein